MSADTKHRCAVIGLPAKITKISSTTESTIKNTNWFNFFEKTIINNKNNKKQLKIIKLETIFQNVVTYRDLLVSLLQVLWVEEAVRFSMLKKHELKIENLSAVV